MKLAFLSKSTPIEKTFMVIPKFTLSYLGFWPERNVTFFLIVRITLHVIVLSIGAFGETIFAVHNRHHLTLALDALCPSTTKLVTLLKLVILFVNRKKFKNLVVRLKAILLTDTNIEKRQKMQDLASIAAIFSFLVLMAGNSTNFVFFLRPIVTNILDYSQGRNLTNALPFLIVVPDSYTKYPKYPILYAILSYSGVVTVFGFSGVDSCFMGFCCHLASAFKIIQCELKTILNNLNDFATEEENQICYNQLRELIKKHVEIIELCKEFSSFITVITLAHFASASMILCISSINLILSSGVDAMLYVSYNTAVLAQLYVYCAGGNYLLESSRKVAEVGYFSEWYKYDIRVRKMILLIILRATKGTGVRVPFFQPSLPAYGMILSTASSYITLLKTFL